MYMKKQGKFLFHSSSLSFLRAGGRWVREVILRGFLLLWRQWVYLGVIPCSSLRGIAGDIMCLWDLECHSNHTACFIRFFFLLKNEQRNKVQHRIYLWREQDLKKNTHTTMWQLHKFDLFSQLSSRKFSFSQASSIFHISYPLPNKFLYRNDFKQIWSFMYKPQESQSHWRLDPEMKQTRAFILHPQLPGESKCMESIFHP